MLRLPHLLAVADGDVAVLDVFGVVRNDGRMINAPAGRTSKQKLYCIVRLFLMSPAALSSTPLLSTHLMKSLCSSLRAPLMALSSPGISFSAYGSFGTGSRRLENAAAIVAAIRVKGEPLGGRRRYQRLPDTNSVMATAKAMAGMAKPHAQLTFSCT